MKRTHLGTAIGATAASIALGMTLAGPAGAVAPDNAPFCAAGAFTLSNTTPGAIPDNNATGVTKSINVAGQTGTVRDVDIVTNITHPVNGELEMELTHTPTSGPAKTVRLITSVIPNRSGANGFDGTRWDDSALGVVYEQDWQSSGAKLNLVPEGAMASFIGRDPNGTWTLRVKDLQAVDTGTLNSWTLDVKTSTQPSTATTQNFVGAGGAIPDAVGPTPGVLQKTVQVSGAKKYLSDLDLLTSITHTANSDLEMKLTSPAGTTVFISRRRGDGSANALTTRWNDSAADLITLAGWAPGQTRTAVVPEGALGAFIGENPNGTWTLSIADIAAADTGTLNGWSLDVASTDGCTPPPPGSNPPPTTTPPRVALPPAAPVCAKVNLATTILGDKRGERGDNATIRLKVANKTRGAGAKGAKAVFKLPTGFTLVKGQKGIALKNGKITVTFGAIAGGKTKTLAIKLKTKAGAALGLKTSSVAVSALCGSKAKAATIKLTVAV